MVFRVEMKNKLKLYLLETFYLNETLHLIKRLCFYYPFLLPERAMLHVTYAEDHLKRTSTMLKDKTLQKGARSAAIKKLHEFHQLLARDVQEIFNFVHDQLIENTTSKFYGDIFDVILDYQKEERNVSALIKHIQVQEEAVSKQWWNETWTSFYHESKNSYMEALKRVERCWVDRADVEINQTSPSYLAFQRLFSRFSLYKSIGFLPDVSRTSRAMYGRFQSLIDSDLFEEAMEKIGKIFSNWLDAHAALIYDRIQERFPNAYEDMLSQWIYVGFLKRWRAYLGKHKIKPLNSVSDVSSAINMLTRIKRQFYMMAFQLEQLPRAGALIALEKWLNKLGDDDWQQKMLEQTAAEEKKVQELESRFREYGYGQGMAAWALHFFQQSYYYNLSALSVVGCEAVATKIPGLGYSPEQASSAWREMGTTAFAGLLAVKDFLSAGSSRISFPMLHMLTLPFLNQLDWQIALGKRLRVDRETILNEQGAVRWFLGLIFQISFTLITSGMRVDALLFSALLYVGSTSFQETAIKAYDFFVKGETSTATKVAVGYLGYLLGNYLTRDMASHVALTFFTYRSDEERLNSEAACDAERARCKALAAKELGLLPDVSYDDAFKQYQQLVRATHPDVSTAETEEQFMQYAKAWGQLGRILREEAKAVRPQALVLSSSHHGDIEVSSVLKIGGPSRT